MRIPCVGLYAATSPDRTGPYGQRHHCLYNENGLDQIAPETVVEKLQEILE
jgi:ADP-heptose:LPS heptosyltransferase